MGTHALGAGIGGCSRIRQPEARIACYGRHAFTQAQAGRLASVARQFDARTAAGTFRGECHKAMHLAGRKYARKHPGRHQAAFREATGVCSSGFAHGIVEQTTLSGGASAFADMAGGWCLSSERPASRTGCYHALGHVASKRKGSSGPTLCEQLGDLLGRDHCLQGVYMNRISSANKPGSGQLCKNVQDRWEFHCWSYAWQASVKGAGQPGDLGRAMRWCSRHASGGLRLAGCVSRAPIATVQGLGSLTACDSLPSAATRAMCSASGAFQATGGMAIDSVARRCSRLKDDDVRFGCAVGFGQRVAWQQTYGWATTHAVSACARLVAKFERAACAQGALGCWPTRPPSGPPCPKAVVPSKYRLPAGD